MIFWVSGIPPFAVGIWMLTWHPIPWPWPFAEWGFTAFAVAVSLLARQYRKRL